MTDFTSAEQSYERDRDATCPGCRQRDCVCDDEIYDDPEREYRRRFGPVRAARTEQLIRLCMVIGDRISERLAKRGGCNCDVDGACKEHQRTPAIAERYLRRLEKRQ